MEEGEALLPQPAKQPPSKRYANEVLYGIINAIVGAPTMISFAAIVYQVRRPGACLSVTLDTGGHPVEAAPLSCFRKLAVQHLCARLNSICRTAGIFRSIVILLLAFCLLEAPFSPCPKGPLWLSIAKMERRLQGLFPHLEAGWHCRHATAWSAFLVEGTVPTG